MVLAAYLFLCTCELWEHELCKTSSLQLQKIWSLGRKSVVAFVVRNCDVEEVTKWGDGPGQRTRAMYEHDGCLQSMSVIIVEQVFTYLRPLIKLGLSIGTR
jgi:hypothetical protein